MKAFKKLLCIFLSAMMLFSLVGIGVQASAAEEEIQIVAQEKDFIQQIKSALQKIHNFLLDVIEKIQSFLGIGYSKLEIKDYSVDSFAVPGLDEGFIPQGVCYIACLDKFAVSGYVKGENSRIYLVDKKTGESKKLEIKNFTEHAGGIASDGDDVWVSSGGSEKEGGFVYHVSARVLEAAENGAQIAFDGSFQTECRASTIFCDGESLIVGEFYERNDYPTNESHRYNKNHAWACGYKLPIAEDAYTTEKRTADFILSIPDKVQGLSLTADKEVIFSCSYGRKNDSTLYVYAPYNEWEKNEITIDEKVVSLYAPTKESMKAKLKMPTLMEGIDIEGESLYVVFESGAKTYSDAKEIITQVWDVNLAELLKKING